MKKFFLSMIAIATMAIAFTGCKQDGGTTPPPATTPEQEAVVPTEGEGEGVTAPETKTGGKIAVIRNLSSDDHTKQFLDGAKTEGEAFGYTVDTFISDGDDARFQELVSQAIQKSYDGMIISHGKAEYSYDMLSPAIEKGMKVVTFDTVIDKEGATLEDITRTAQDDELLAKLSLDEVVAKAKEEGKPARVIKVWYGPGVPPLDNRNVIYKQYEEQGLIETLENIGPSNLQDAQGEVSTRLSAVLPKYKEGDVDAIWGAWDELAKGALIALKDSGRTDIPMISIDVSNQDINLMREQPDVWQVTAAVDPYLIGTINMRLLAMKLNGDETPQTYSLEPKVIRASELKEDTSMSNLDVIVDGWGKSDDFNQDWMKALRN